MKINVRGPMNALIGYGHCCFNIVKSLTELGHEIAYFPIGNPQLTTNDAELIQQCIKNQDTFDSSAPSLTIWHENHLAERIGGGPHITLSFYEMDRLDDRRINHLTSSDHIISPSSWWTDILQNELFCSDFKDVDKVLTDDFITTIPMGVDSTIFNSNNTSRPDGPTTFLNIGKIEVRKGHDILAKAFKEAFPDENVILAMMWSNPFLSQDEVKEWTDLYINTIGADRVRFIPYVKTDYELAKIINSVDCCVFPTRAEGFGMPILQSLACGKPVISTDYSAHADFVNEDNSMLIHIDEMETAYDGKWFFGQGEWAKLGTKQIDELVEYLSLVHAGKRRNDIVPDISGPVKTAQNFSWERTAKSIEGVLNGCLETQQV